MRLSKHKRNTRADMNMTPMIDIVFLLIIFFMTVTQVSEVNRERVELPRLQGAEDQKPATLTINVNRDGDIIVSGNQIEMPRLLAIVSQELAKVGDNASLLTIVLRADERGTSRTVNDVVKSLARMQITRVRVAVQVPP